MNDHDRVVRWMLLDAMGKIKPWPPACITKQGKLTQPASGFGVAFRYAPVRGQRPEDWKMDIDEFVHQHPADAYRCRTMKGRRMAAAIRLFAADDFNGALAFMEDQGIASGFDFGAVQEFTHVADLTRTMAQVIMNAMRQSGIDLPYDVEEHPVVGLSVALWKA